MFPPNSSHMMEAALVEAAARLRVSQPDLTALQLHTLIVEQTEFASATLSEVKKASSKASKQLAKMPAETPTPAPALPARSARSANDPHDLAGVFKGYGAAMRRHKRLDVSRGLAALKTALQHCERTQPQDSLIRAALLDKMSMYQWMLDDKASELHTHGDGSDDSDSDASSSPTSSDSSISWLSPAATSCFHATIRASRACLRSAPQSGHSLIRGHGKRGAFTTPGARCLASRPFCWRRTASFI